MWLRRFLLLGLGVMGIGALLQSQVFAADPKDAAGGVTAPKAAAVRADDVKAAETQAAEKRKAAQVAGQVARDAAASLAKVRQSLVEAARRERQLDTDARRLRVALHALQNEVKEKTENLAREQARAAETSSALLKVSRLPPEAMLLAPSAPLDSLRAGVLLRSALPLLEARAASLSEDLNALKLLQKQLEERRLAAEVGQGRLDQERATLTALLAERRRAASQLSAEHAQLRDEAAALAQNAADLKELMAKVAISRLPPPPRRKGATAMPVLGEVLTGFGQTDSFGVKSQGLILKAEAGAPIVAPQGGRVAFAGPFKGYGLILILTQADGYHALLSGFGRIDVGVGDTVEAGEPVGVIADGDAPSFYYELRRNGEPVDPLRP